MTIQHHIGSGIDAEPGYCACVKTSIYNSDSATTADSVVCALEQSFIADDAMLYK